MSDYFGQLEHELTRAAARGGRPRRRGRRAVLLAAAALVVAGVPAAAVTGAFDEDTEDAVGRLMHEPGIAEGTTARGTRWRLVAEQRGEQFCLGLATPSDRPGELQPAFGGGCPDQAPGTLTVFAASTSLSRLSPRGPRHSLAYGTAPDAAARVRIGHPSSGGTVTVRTFDDRGGIAGRFYVAEIPLRWQRARRRVEALDATGAVVARAGG